ncbi:DUF2586 family protein [Aureibacter tunicatorum]|uniref:Uncharacterized protein n=1 Tax=Aureibacter tunicatorum TaxID=866807 RepID=A0AAE3XU38_9BACT|nr:DUF2586 family protein [Aureibacter tunicatorum]MDR6241891.1 hypothetical protein [Aureibacter tunicatorum]
MADDTAMDIKLLSNQQFTVLMPLNDINIEKLPGGLGRYTSGGDHISGLICYAPCSGIFAKHASSGKYTMLAKSGENHVYYQIRDIATLERIELDIFQNILQSNDSLVDFLNDTMGTDYIKSEDPLSDPDVYLQALKKIEEYAVANTITRQDTFSTDPEFIYALDRKANAGIHYHASEFFRINPNGVLHLMLVNEKPSDFSELAQLQLYAEGSIRQIGIYDQFSDSDPTTLQSNIQAINEQSKMIAPNDAENPEVYKPFLSIYSIQHDEDFDYAADLKLFESPFVCMSIGQDLSGQGYKINKERYVQIVGIDKDNRRAYINNSHKGELQENITLRINGQTLSASISNDQILTFNEVDFNVLLENWMNFSVELLTGDGSAFIPNTRHGCIGTMLGTISKAKVNEHIGWVKKFNISRGNEFKSIGFSNGRDYNSYSRSELDALADRSYIFLRKLVGDEGAYFSDSKLCMDDSQNDDIPMSIEELRSTQKSKRLLEERLKYASRDVEYRIKVNELNDLTLDYSLTKDSQKGIINKMSRPLEDMKRKGEISDYSLSLTDNGVIGSRTFNSIQERDQQFLTNTEGTKLDFTYEIVPRGTARYININFTYSHKL